MSWVITGSEKTPVDPQFGSVSLLLHGNGANGSTTITDSSRFANTVTAVGNAQISTAQSKFGGSSLLFDGTGDRLTIPSSTDFAFGTGDFTVEAWVYEASRTTYPSVLEIGNHLLNTGIIFITNGSPGAGIYSDGFFAATTAGSLSTWNHYAWVRSGNFVRTYVNGVGGTAASFTNSLTNTATVTIGSVG